MFKLKRTKILASLILLICLSSLTFVSASPIEVRELPPEVMEELKRVEETGAEFVIEPMAVDCPKCGGLISTRKIGTGGWEVTESKVCRQHNRCSILVERRYHYYEESCGSRCGYFRDYKVPEYKETHKM